MPQKNRSLMSTIVALAGRFLCSIGSHKYTSESMYCVHPIFQCTRAGCDHAYADHQGGYRLGVKSIPNIASQLSDNVAKDFL